MLVNLKSGTSKVFEYNDLLFLKHTGISTKLTAKNEVIVERRKKAKWGSTKGFVKSKSIAMSSIKKVFKCNGEAIFGKRLNDGTRLKLFWDSVFTNK